MGTAGRFAGQHIGPHTWLSTQSSASVDVYDQSKPTLTADFLSQYDVIVIQWLRDVSDAGNDGALWQFTQDEVNALTAGCTRAEASSP